MSNAFRNRQMNTLAGASRVAGRRGGLAGRTHYLGPAELRTVPASRLLRETAWAERPDASDAWRDQRRDVVADEFYRRGFHDAADTVRSRWEPAEYDGARVLAEQQRLEAERHELEADRDHVPDRSAETVAWAVATLATASVIVDEQSMEQVTGRLDRSWEGENVDPAMGGDLDMDVGADLSDSLAAGAELSATKSGFEAPTPAVTPEVETEAEL